MADSRSSEANKKQRQPNFNDVEIRTVIEFVKENFLVLNSKLTNVLTLRAKRTAWQSVTDSVNAVGMAVRTVAQVKKKWEDLASTAKKTFSSRKNPPTGGGPKPPEPVHTEAVLDVIGLNSATLCGIVSSRTGESCMEVKGKCANVDRK